MSDERLTFTLPPGGSIPRQNAHCHTARRFVPFPASDPKWPLSLTDPMPDYYPRVVPPEQWKAGLRDLREAIAGNEPEIRLRLRNYLLELITKVEVFAAGFEKRYNPDQLLPEGSFAAPALHSEDFAEEVDAMLQEYAP